EPASNCRRSLDHLRAINHSNYAGRTSETGSADNLECDACQYFTLPAEHSTVGSSPLDKPLCNHRWTTTRPPFGKVKRVTLDGKSLDSPLKATRAAQLLETCCCFFERVRQTHTPAAPSTVCLQHPRKWLL